MALHEFEPQADSQAQPQPNHFEVWEDEVDDIPFSHLGRKISEYHVAMNDVYLGQLHLDESLSRQVAVSDGFYPGPDGQEIVLSDQQWQELAFKLYAGGLTKARRIEHPGGRNLFLEAI